MFGTYKVVSSENVSEFQALAKPGWINNYLEENSLLTSEEVTFTYENGFIHEQWARGLLLKYVLNNPISFKGLEGEEVVMSAFMAGTTLTLVNSDGFGNEIVTERIFSDEGMEQATFLSSGGVRAVRKFKKILMVEMEGEIEEEIEEAEGVS